MQEPEEQITFFAKTNFRNREVPFGIKTDDRRRHMYVIGKTGMGKTTLMENMAIQDIRNGHGVCFMDPHGDSVVKILDFIPSSRVNDVIYFNPADLEYPIAFNIMESVEGKFKHLVASGLMGVFTKIWANLWSARMEYILGNTVRALLDSPGNSMLGITRMYIDKQYRKRIVDNIKDPMVRVFWTDEYANYDQKYVKEAVAPIQNKVGQFLSSAIIRNIVGQPKSTIDLREIMDNRKILLMDLSKGKVGEENAALLGAMIITKLQLAAMSRVDMPEQERPDFYLYVDEFQNFATESFATILSEARKYHLNLIMGHQYIGQLTPTRDNTRLRDAIFGNIGTMICFRVGAADAEYLETEFAPVYTPNDLVNLPKYHILLKLMINGVSSEPFSARSIPVNPEFHTDNAEKVVRVSRERYGNPIAAVEERISRWMGAEFHQRSAAMAADQDMDALPVPSVEPIEEKRAVVNSVEPTSEIPTRAVERGVVKPEEVVVPKNEPLVFKIPPATAPARPVSFGGGQSKQSTPTGRSSSRLPQRQEQVPQSRTDRSDVSRFPRREHNTPKSARPTGPKRHGEADKKTVTPRPNIWDTVEEIRQEKEVVLLDKLATVLETTSARKPEKVQQAHKHMHPSDARGVQDDSSHKKVIKPGEVHTF
ncbi:MAG: type IV secretion system DNA-binding domain-containing protein [Candidatus Doudnabacteria bacterium]|nr:type IV secretion system DNA-binding domain-containing protein [Candidatus Doudnabacteria bacterium]